MEHFHYVCFVGLFSNAAEITKKLIKRLILLTKIICERLKISLWHLF